MRGRSVNVRAFGIIGLLFAAILLILIGVFWWTSRPPRRPAGLSANALYIERGVVPFKLSSTPGDWIDCWFDQHQQIDRCKITDETGKLEFEDVFVPYEGQSPVPQDRLRFAQGTGSIWTGTYENHLRYPLIYLTDGEILLPRSDFQKAKETTDWAEGKHDKRPK